MSEILTSGTPESERALMELVVKHVATIARLEAELTRLREENEGLREERDRADTTIVEMGKVIERLRATFDAYRRVDMAEEKEMNDDIETLSKFITKYVNDDGPLSESWAALGRLEAEFTRRVTIEWHNEQVQEFIGCQDAYQAEVEGLRTQTEEQLAHINGHHADLDRVNAEVERLQATIDNAKSACFELEPDHPVRAALASTDDRFKEADGFYNSTRPPGLD